MNNNNENHQDELPAFRPDLGIVYPNKQELYRKEVTLPFFTIKRFLAAASLILTAGIIWWLNDDQNREQQVALTAPATTNVSVEKNLIERTKQGTGILKSSVAQKTAMTSKAAQPNASVVASSSPAAINNIQAIVPYQEVVQQELVSAQVEQPQSNFSADALQASAQAISKNISLDATPSSTEKAEVYIPMTVESERKRPLRGLVRKLSRTILGEGESLGDIDIIQVANFKIPRSN